MHTITTGGSPHLPINTHASKSHDAIARKACRHYKCLRACRQLEQHSSYAR